MEAAEGQTESPAGQSLVAGSAGLERSYILEVRTASWSEPLAQGPTGIPRVALVMGRPAGPRGDRNVVPAELPEGIYSVVPSLFGLVKGVVYCCGFTYSECGILHTPGFSGKVDKISCFFGFSSLFLPLLFLPPPCCLVCSFCLWLELFWPGKRGFFFSVLRSLTPTGLCDCRSKHRMNSPVHSQSVPCAFFSS